MTDYGRDRTAGGAILLDGKRTAEEIRQRITAELIRLGKPTITLATVLVGEDAPSQIYIRNKRREAEKAGLRSRHLALPARITQKELEKQVSDLCADPDVHAILVQFPLPKGLNAQAVIELIPPEKDVDGLTERNLGKLVRGQPGLVPCTPKGIMRLLERYAIPVAGSRAVVVGRSTLVGLPMVLLLGAKGADATVTLAHSRTPNLAQLTRQADILVSAAGVAGLITRDHVKPGAAVFDVGVSSTDRGIHGDVDFAAVQNTAGAITPMPGGTGPMTVACLLENAVEAARMQGVVPALEGSVQA
jgi:methylenetetrahydrofolate dehydrogenase (NADP+)/methenyltetrahydrofolate cyclohydrolase